MTRTRSILYSGIGPGGKGCPALTETIPCEFVVQKLDFLDINENSGVIEGKITWQRPTGGAASARLKAIFFYLSPKPKVVQGSYFIGEAPQESQAMLSIPETLLPKWASGRTFYLVAFVRLQNTTHVFPSLLHSGTAVTYDDVGDPSGDCNFQRWGPNGESCKNGAKCKDIIPLDQSYLCDCAHDNHFGENCELIGPVDCDVSAYGPGGKGCNDGVCIDKVDRDQQFECSCAGTPFTGSNCDVRVFQNQLAPNITTHDGSEIQKSSNIDDNGSWVIIIAVAGGVFVLTLAAYFIYERKSNDARESQKALNALGAPQGFNSSPPPPLSKSGISSSEMSFKGLSKDMKDYKNDGAYFTVGNASVNTDHYFYMEDERSVAGSSKSNWNFGRPVNIKDSREGMSTTHYHPDEDYLKKLAFSPGRI